MAFWAFIAQIAISIAISFLAYALLPKPRRAKPPEAQDAQAPTAEAGRPMPVVFGSITVAGVNVLHYTDKKSRSFEVDA